MKLVGLFATALYLAGIVPSLASYHFDSTHLASRDWADEPFGLVAREYEDFERDLDIEGRDDDFERDLDIEGRDDDFERDLDIEGRDDDFERDLDIEGQDDDFERDLDIEGRDDDFWERSPYNEDQFIYRRAPRRASEGYKKLIALNPKMQVGHSYAFEMTFPLIKSGKKPAEKKTANKKETANEKRLREMRIQLGYSHKALLVGTVTPDKDFKGALYDMAIESIDTLHIASKSFEWKVENNNPLTSKGEVKSSWTKEKIVKAGYNLNHEAERGGKYGFEKWHCGIFVEDLFLTLTRDPPK
ncbi:hypothetical protein BDZ97DRAFT_1916475 [Flammula alnicola]|nr:hypothetical protein BDZ97DRAFT_1916475 [Flammula alnicola]